MTLHIYYRHTSVARSSGKARPPWFSHANCLVNLLDTISDHLRDGSVRLNVLFDGNEAEMQADFAMGQVAQHIAAQPSAANAITERRIQGGTQRTAWRACIGIVKDDAETRVASGDLVYLLENDYLHMPGWVDEVLALRSQGIEWDYLTLYDHPDKYPNQCDHVDAARYHALPARLFASSRRHWRTTPSTCASYVLSRETFLRDHSVLRLGLYDLRLFRLLTTFKRRTLISPLPGMSTHCMAGLLSPIVDWGLLAQGERTAPSAAKAPNDVADAV